MPGLYEVVGAADLNLKRKRGLMKKISTKISAILLTLAIFLNFSLTGFASQTDVARSWDEEIIYMVMTDRFFDGDPSNNNPSNVDGAYDKDHLEAYHGGDFRGLIEKIPYLKDLGVTTLWITPIVKNIEDNMMADSGGKQFAYHGYWAEDFTRIDPHLGSEADLKELIDTLHDNGMKLMVDVVINHSGYGTKNQGVFAGMHRENPEPGDIKSELDGLPDFITEDKEVRDKIINWQVDWLRKLKTDKGNSIDYFRVDTVKHVDQETMKDFKSAALAIDPNFKMIGENFGASVINNGGYLDPSMMDSLLDFEFKDLAKAFVNGKVEETEKKLVNRNHNISQEKQMGQFLSSHDEHGFLKMKVSDDLGKFLLASSLQLTAKGQPVIYYGEEIGMSGRKDDFAKGIFSENRYDFDWSKTENNQVLDHYNKLLAIRNAYPEIFAKGDRIGLVSEDGVSVFKRIYDNQEIIVGLNTNEEAKTVSFELDKVDEKLIDLYGKQRIKISGNEATLSLLGRAEGGTAILAYQSTIPEGIEVDDQGQGSRLAYIGLGLIALAILSLILRKTKPNKVKAAS